MTNPVIIGNATLYLGDCREILPTLPKVDAVVTDPPYGMNLDTDFSKMKSKIFKGKTGGVGYAAIKGDDSEFHPQHLFISEKILLFGPDYYANQIPKTGTWLVWDKRLDESADKMWGSIFELIWVSIKCKKDILRHKWAGIFGMEREDEPIRLHPTQKPVGLMERCVNLLKAERVLDAYMGSGTTGVACMNLGRKFIGIEIEPKYFDIACRRIDDAQRQQRMFA